jgi:hypothetical protein
VSPEAGEDIQRINREVLEYGSFPREVGEGDEYMGVGGWQPRAGSVAMVLKNAHGVVVQSAGIHTDDVARAISDLGWETV